VTRAEMINIHAWSLAPNRPRDSKSEYESPHIETNACSVIWGMTNLGMLPVCALRNL
jgi:hypothetical protein